MHTKGKYCNLISKYFSFKIIINTYNILISTLNRFKQNVHVYHNTKVLFYIEIAQPLDL